MFKQAARPAAFSHVLSHAVPHLPTMPLRSVSAATTTKFGRAAVTAASKAVESHSRLPAAPLLAAPALAVPRVPLAHFFATSAGGLDADAVVVTRSCAQRIKQLQGETPDLKLRISVDGGGCSGFQYVFDLDGEPIGADDCVFERDGAQVVIDEASLEFVKGATVDYVEEMIRSSFAVINNPNSESACGCGSSFALKAFEANPALD
eukprot:CAMPEP_0205904804 /NCGR_PEP_ID=MMETSP1325-20131115/953_1 /ASSEMBLY_ACC=CAM_ASM_000708 /TAXON_ID=236786 /ORGANISM="Florenciella sp., Strain RCC1007" /LENGTH=205 /DNA_ID=CAMNT_0053270631 /DNA_START=10 /DNA_END=627 /DNA_ORIENTATION=+